MGLTSFFALRYLFSPSRMGAVNWVSGISAVAIAVVSMALVVALSVYNGYVKLILQTTGAAAPELLITPQQGATLDMREPTLLTALESDLVASYSPMLRAKGVIRHLATEQMVDVVGVAPEYWQVVGGDSLLLEGRLPKQGSSTPEILVGMALASEGISPMAQQDARLYFPRRQGLINPLAPGTAFRSTELVVTGIMRPVDEEFDRQGYVDISVMHDLLAYQEHIATAVALRLARGVPPTEGKQRLAERLVGKYHLLDRAEQHPELTFLIRMEKLMVFLIMTFILLLAAFNLASGLAMLILEKRADLQTLRALGMTSRMEGRIFALAGVLISLLGSFVGVTLGLILSWLQERFELIEAGQGLLTMPFPIDIQASDILLILLCTTLVSCVISMVPSFFFKKKRS